MSTHLSRLLPRLLQRNISFQMYNLLPPVEPHPLVRDVSGRPLRWLLSMLFGRPEKVHYVAGSRWVTRLATCLLKLIRGRKILLLIGGEDPYHFMVDPARWPKKAPGYQRWLTRVAVRHADVVVGVAPQLCELAVRAGAEPSRVHCISHFIAPQDDGTEAPRGVLEFARHHDPVLLVTGQINPRGSKDVYGFSMIPDLARRLARDYPRVGFLIYAYEIQDLGPRPFEQFVEDVRSRGLQDSILVHRSRGQLWPAMKLARVFLRPSLTDGDANSIREALSMGVPVVASDCLFRPPPTVVFRTSDAEEFHRATLDVLRNHSKYRDLALRQDAPDNAGKIIDLIEELLSR